jgi:hypothetical protein
VLSGASQLNATSFVPPEFGSRLIAKVSEVPLAVAVKSTDCWALTAVVVAVKLTEVLFEGTVTMLGKATAALLLERLTTNPPVGAAAFKVRLQLSVSAPERTFELQASALSPGVPVPLRFAIVVGSGARLLVIIRGSVALPDAVGVNCSLRVTLPLAGRVIGKVAPPTIEKSPPLAPMSSTLTAETPRFFKVMLAVAV